jgi:hypothetical protein
MRKNGFLKDGNEDTVMASPTSPVGPLFDFGHHTIADLKLPTAVTVLDTLPCSEAARIMEKNHFDQGIYSVDFYTLFLTSAFNL